MWSFGVSLYQLAVAYLPTAIKQYKYGSGPIPFRRVDWTNFEGFADLRDLIERCLEMEPRSRITADEALNHRWFEI
jgi:serine/threonine protein kinase